VLEDMSQKQIKVEDSLECSPNQEIEFIAAVRQGLSELDRGGGIPIEEVERELSPATRALEVSRVDDPGVSLRSTPGFMLSAAPRALK
jgi:hypothetical protein